MKYWVAKNPHGWNNMLFTIYLTNWISNDCPLTCQQKAIKGLQKTHGYSSGIHFDNVCKNQHHITNHHHQRKIVHNIFLDEICSIPIDGKHYMLEDLLAWLEDGGK